MCESRGGSTRLRNLTLAMVGARIEPEVRYQIDQRLRARGWILDPERHDRDVFIEQSVFEHLATIPRQRLQPRTPDYTFFADGTPIAVLEAKKPRSSIRNALDQGADYAQCMDVDFVFACNGPVFKSLHLPSNQPLYLNHAEVSEPLAPGPLRRFRDGHTNDVVTVPARVIESRQQMITVFERLNNVLRQAGIRAGLDRFTEFANILFLKLASESDPEDIIWEDLLNRGVDDLPGYLNNYMVPRLRDRYASDVLTRTKVGGPALKAIIQELNPLHLTSVDEDLKGIAFEHFLRRTTSSNDLGEYFTPRDVVKFMVRLLNPEFGKTVFDPFCGTGGFLVEVFRYLSQQVSLTQTSSAVLHRESIYGRELTTTARIAKMNMILFGDGHSGVVQGDSLTPTSEDRYDAVISNIPFSLQIDGNTLRAVDAEANDADEACLIKCFNSVKPGGAMAVVVPDGLVASDTHRYLWSRLFRGSRVRVIARLPRGSFAPYTDAATNILYLTDKGTKHTDWFYHVVLSGDKARGETIGRDEFLFFYEPSDDPLTECPPGVKVVPAGDGTAPLSTQINRSWTIRSRHDIVGLDKVASINNGQMITKAETNPGPYKVIGGGRGTISCYHDRTNTEPGCLTISKSGAYAGYAWWHEEPIWASDCLVIRSKNEQQFLSFFLYLCLKAQQEVLYSRQEGTGQPHIYRRHVADFPVPRLTLREQRAIVEPARRALQQRLTAQHSETAALDQALVRIESLYEGETTMTAKPETKIPTPPPQPADTRQVAEVLLRYRTQSEVAHPPQTDLASIIGLFASGGSDIANERSEAVYTAISERADRKRI